MIFEIIISSFSHSVVDYYECPGKKSTGFACFGLPYDGVKWGLKYIVDLNFSDDMIQKSLVLQNDFIKKCVNDSINSYRIEKRNIVIDEVLR